MQGFSVAIWIELDKLSALTHVQLKVQANRRDYASEEYYAHDLIQRALERQMLAYLQRELEADRLQTDEQLKAMQK